MDVEPSRRWPWVGSWVDRPIVRRVLAGLLLVGCVGAIGQAVVAGSDARLLHAAVSENQWCSTADSSSCVRRVAATLHPSQDQVRDTADLWSAEDPDGALVGGFTVGNAHDDLLRPWVGTDVVVLMHRDRVLGVELGSGQVVEAQTIGDRAVWSGALLAVACLFLAGAFALGSVARWRARGSLSARLAAVALAGWLPLALDLPSLLVPVGLGLAGLAWVVVGVGLNARHELGT